MVKVTLELNEEQAMTILSALNSKGAELDGEHPEQAQRQREVRDAILPKFRKKWDAARAKEREDVRAMWSTVMTALDKARET